MNLIEKDFEHLGRTEKSNFISEHIEYATPKAVGRFVRGYLFDVLKSVSDDGYIIDYITERGYKVEKKQPNEQLPYIDWNNTGFMNEMSVVLVRSYAPINKFQKELVRMLSPLHGMCVMTERVDDIYHDIAGLVEVLSNKYPRRNTKAHFCYGKKHDCYGQECKAIWIDDIKDSSPDGNNVVYVYFYQLKGMLHYAGDGGFGHMCAVPFESDRITWAMEYNNTVEQEGGER